MNKETGKNKTRQQIARNKWIKNKEYFYLIKNVFYRKY